MADLDYSTGSDQVRFGDDVHVEGDLTVKGSVSFSGADMKFAEIDSQNSTLPISIQGTSKLTLSATAVYPTTNAGLALGSSTNGFNSLYLSDGTGRAAFDFDSYSNLQFGTTTNDHVIILRNSAVALKITGSEWYGNSDGSHALGLDSIGFSALYLSNGTTRASVIPKAGGVVAGLVQTVPEAAVADEDLSAGSMNAWVDQAGNNLTFKVKYSDGTVKSGTVALS